MTEIFDIYDESGRWVGTAPRNACHGDPKLIHRTAHVVILHPETGRMLLQKRSAAKDIQPGRWDTAVGGHLEAGECFEEAAGRELAEELGIGGPVELTVLFDSRIRNAVESEDVRVFGAKLAGPFTPQASEIDEVRFWSRAELADPEARKNFTPNLLQELEVLEKCGFYPPATT